MTPPPMTRREFLVAVAASAAMVGCGGGEQPEEARPALEALRRAAAAPGPAMARLASLAVLPHRPLYRLPFQPSEVPGFTAATHRVHYEHHYIEYFCRWVEGERRVLERAADLADAGARGESEAVDKARRAVWGALEQMRVSANMVMLHEAYWRDFWGGTERAMADVAPLAQTLLPIAGGLDLTWLVAGDDARLYVYKDSDSIPLGLRPVAGIDLPEHAWALDFGDIGVYMGRLLRNVSPACFDAFTAAKEPSHLARIPPPAAPTTDTGDFDSQLRHLADLHRFPRADVAAAGLLLAAGPGGCAAILRRSGTEDRTLAILSVDAPSGIWGHDLLSVRRNG